MFKILETVKLPVSVNLVALLHSVCCFVFWLIVLLSQNPKVNFFAFVIIFAKTYDRHDCISSQDLCCISDEVCIQSSLRFLKLSL